MKRKCRGLFKSDGYRISSHMEWGDGRTADQVYTRDDEGKVLNWERIWYQSDGSESHRIRQEYVYNSQGDCRRIYWQRTSAKSASDKSKTTYYIYDYDGIDPSVDDSYRSME